MAKAPSHHKKAAAAPPAGKKAAAAAKAAPPKSSSTPMAGAASGAGRAFRAGGAAGGAARGAPVDDADEVAAARRRGVSGVSGGVFGGFGSAGEGCAAARACFAVVGEDEADGARFFHLVRIEGSPGPGHPPGSARVRWLKEDLRDGLYRPDGKATTWVERRAALVPVRAAWVDAPPGKASGGGLRLLTMRSRLLQPPPALPQQAGALAA